jgi:hypothetical protein
LANFNPIIKFRLFSLAFFLIYSFVNIKIDFSSDFKDIGDKAGNKHGFCFKFCLGGDVSLNFNPDLISSD